MLGAKELFDLITRLATEHDPETRKDLVFQEQDSSEQFPSLQVIMRAVPPEVLSLVLSDVELMLQKATSGEEKIIDAEQRLALEQRMSGTGNLRSQVTETTAPNQAAVAEIAVGTLILLAETVKAN